MNGNINKRVPVMDWPQAYLEEAIDDEILLAEAKFPGARIERPSIIVAVTQLTFAPPPRTQGTSTHNVRTNLGGYIAPWRRSWQHAGPLSTELGLNTHHDPEEGSVSVSIGAGRRNVTERYEDHPDKDAATCAAIVRAAIRKLEGRSGE